MHKKATEAVNLIAFAKKLEIPTFGDLGKLQTKCRNEMGITALQIS